MNFLIKAPRAIDATITLPSSKSICNRVLLLNALAYSPYDIENLSDCDDTRVMLQMLNANTNTFNVGAAGTAMRFMTAFLSKIVGEWTLTGSERMKNRPIGLLVDALNNLGARIEYLEKEGYPPLRIYGSALKGGVIEMDGGVSSQYISALLMIAPTMEEGLTIRLQGEVISRPYIQLTIDLMKQFGVTAEWKDNEISVLPAEYQPLPFVAEPDWSAASYWYSMVALSEKARVVLPGLKKDSLQGDSVVAALFTQLGVETAYDDKGVTLAKTGRLTEHLEHDFTDTPDLAQTFVVACALLGVPFRFTGLQSLKIKETDRLEALRVEMNKLGYTVKIIDDRVLECNSRRMEAQAVPTIETYDDHRMAMAFAPVAIKRPDGLVVANPQVVTKSYPMFWEDLLKAGFTITSQHTE